MKYDFFSKVESVEMVPREIQFHHQKREFQFHHRLLDLICKTPVSLLLLPKLAVRQHTSYGRSLWTAMTANSNIIEILNRFIEVTGLNETCSPVDQKSSCLICKTRFYSPDLNHDSN